MRLAPGCTFDAESASSAGYFIQTLASTALNLKLGALKVSCLSILLSLERLETFAFAEEEEATFVPMRVELTLLASRVSQLPSARSQSDVRRERRFSRSSLVPSVSQSRDLKRHPFISSLDFLITHTQP